MTNENMSGIFLIISQLSGGVMEGKGGIKETEVEQAEELESIDQ